MIRLDNGEASGTPSHEFVQSADGPETDTRLNYDHPKVSTVLDEIAERHAALERELIDLAKRFGSRAVLAAAQELPSTLRRVDTEAALTTQQEVRERILAVINEDSIVDFDAESAICRELAYSREDFSRVLGRLQNEGKIKYVGNGYGIATPLDS